MTDDLIEWPNNIVADRHEVTGKWVLFYLTDEQAAICGAAFARHRSASNASPNPITDTQAVEWLTENYGGSYGLFVDPMALFQDFHLPNSALPEPQTLDVEACIAEINDNGKETGYISIFDASRVIRRHAEKAPKPESVNAERFITECLDKIGNPNWFQTAKELALALYLKDKTITRAESMAQGTTGDASTRKDEGSANETFVSVNRPDLATSPTSQASDAPAHKDCPVMPECTNPAHRRADTDAPAKQPVDALLQCRAAFENWHNAVFQEPLVWNKERNLYEEFGHQEAWRGWKAAWGNRTNEFRCEIPVVDEADIANLVLNVIHTYVSSRDLNSVELAKRATQKILDIYRPYLRPQPPATSAASKGEG